MRGAARTRRDSGRAAPRSSRPRSPQGRSGRWRRARPLLGGRCPPSPSRRPGARRGSARSPALCLRRGDRNAIAAQLPLSPALVVLKRGGESESFPALRVKVRRKTAPPPPPAAAGFLCVWVYRQQTFSWRPRFKCFKSEPGRSRAQEVPNAPVPVVVRRRRRRSSVARRPGAVQSPRAVRTAAHKGTRGTKNQVSADRSPRTPPPPPVLPPFAVI